MTLVATPTAILAINPRQQFLDSFKREHETTMKVVRALPPESSEFKPHPRSNSTRQLAFTFLLEQKLLMAALTDSLKMTGKFPEAPESIKAIIEEFETDYPKVCQLIESVSDESLANTVQFPIGPGPQMGDWPKMEFLWFILCDQIHHRGQLSVYVRMAGGKVPSIYGPSADEPWF
jgi:uncharacterized damage-inducible protein DinB